MKKVLIIGKGWLGSKLESYLGDEFEITTTKRNSDSENCIPVNFDEEITKQSSASNYDCIIITVPFGKRNSQDELNFRFNQLINFIGDFSGQIILISSAGIYPESEQIINETTFRREELNQPYLFIEEKMKNVFSSLIILRLGGLMGEDRYLSKYITLDANNLDQVVNHTHYLDVCRVIKIILEQNLHNKLYNVVAPEHPTKEEVLTYQVHQKIIKSTTKKGKIISSNTLINELNYQFIFPNPLYFKE